MQLLKGVTIGFDEDTMKAFEQWEKIERRKRTDLVRIAVKSYLVKIGYLKEKRK